MNGENIYSVGVIDDRKVPFHRLILEDGTTYNSYLLKTEKPTIIDTVDFIYSKQYLENLKKLIDLKEIQYIVINHTEPDHSGALGSLAKQASNIFVDRRDGFHRPERDRRADEKAREQQPARPDRARSWRNSGCRAELRLRAGHRQAVPL